MLPISIEPITKGIISRAQVTKILNAADDPITLQAVVARVLDRGRTRAKRCRVSIMADEVLPDADPSRMQLALPQKVQLLQAPALTAERTLEVAAYPARDEPAEWARTYLEVIHTGEQLRDNDELPEDVARGLPQYPIEIIESLGRLATRTTARETQVESESAVEN